MAVLRQSSAMSPCLSQLRRDKYWGEPAVGIPASPHTPLRLAFLYWLQNMEISTTLDIPTAPTTPVQGDTASRSTAMGGGDRAPRSTFSHAVTTPLAASSLFVRGGSHSTRKPRPLGVASPPAMPLWMYSPPPRRPNTITADSCKPEASPSEAPRPFPMEALYGDLLQETSTNQGLTALRINGTLRVPIDLHKEF